MRSATFLSRPSATAWYANNPTPTRPALAAFVAQQPRVLPQPKRRARAYRAATWALWVVFALLVLALALLLFLVFGEERPEQVRPKLTPAQRAAAFRIPQP